MPLWFLAEAGWAGPTVVLSLNYPEDGGLSKLGEAIAAAAHAFHRRIAIVASGDMSHRLTPNAPCGFHPQAHQFDETFIRLIRDGDYHEIGNIDPELRELAAEDAVDSTLVAAAAVDWRTTGHKVLNYEGPFGVGYGVAILFARTIKPGRSATVSNSRYRPRGHYPARSGSPISNGGATRQFRASASGHRSISQRATRDFCNPARAERNVARLRRDDSSRLRQPRC